MRNKIVILLIVIHCVLDFSPMFSSGVPCYLNIGITIVLLILTLPWIKSIYSLPVLIYTTCFWGLTVLYFLFRVSLGEIVVTARIPMFLFSVFLTMYCYENMNKKEIELLLAVIVIVVFANLLYNAIYCTMHPLAAAESVRNIGLRQMNVGATKFSHFAFSFFLVSLCVVLNCGERRVRVLFLLLTMLAGYYILFCGQRMTVIILMLFSLAVLLCEKITGKLFSLPTILLIVLMIGVMNINLIIDVLQKVSTSKRVDERLLQIEYIVQHGLDESSFSGRIHYYKISLGTIFDSLRNFLFGIGYKEADLAHKKSIGIGGHSEILDTFAMYGILGMSFLYLIFKYTYKSIVQIMPDRHCKRQFTIILFFFLLMSCLKHPFDAHNSLLLFFVLPLMFRLIENKKKQWYDA